MDTEYLFTEMRDDGFTDAARIEDLGPNDFAKVGSAACERQLSSHGSVSARAGWAVLILIRGF